MFVLHSVHSALVWLHHIEAIAAHAFFVVSPRIDWVWSR